MTENKKSSIGVIIAIVVVLLLIGSCGGDSNSGSGGRCRICGTQTNWTYRGGGYLCYSCDKKYYGEIDNDYNFVCMFDDLQLKYYNIEFLEKDRAKVYLQ